MREFKQIGFVALLCVAPICGRNTLTAAPTPQEDGQRQGSTADSSQDSSSPWGTPTNLSLFFAHRGESGSAKVDAMIETASALKRAGEDDFAVSVLMEAGDLAEQIGVQEIVEVAAALSEMERSEQARRLCDQAVQLAKQSRSEYSRRSAYVRLIPGLAKAGAITEAIDLAEEINSAGGGVRMIGLDGKTELIRPGDQILSTAAAGLLRIGHGDDALTILRHLADGMTLAKNPQSLSKLVKQVDDAIGKANRVESLRSASDLAQYADDPNVRFNLQHKIARGLTRAGDTKGAQEYARRSAATIVEIREPQRNSARATVAVALAEAGNIDGAIEMAHRIETTNGTSAALTQVATIIAETDQERAIALLGKATELAKEVELAALAASLRVNVAKALIKVDERERAISTLQPVVDASKDGESSSYLLLSLGSLVAEAGDQTTAHAVLERATELAKTINDPLARSMVLSSIAAAFHKAGDQSGASTAINLAAEVAAKIENPQRRATNLQSLARSAEKSVKVARQIEILTLAFDAAKEDAGAGSNRLARSITIDVARVGGLKRAKPMFDSLGSIDEQIALLRSIAEAMNAAGKRREVLEAIDQAIDLAIGIKGERSYHAALRQLAITLSSEPGSASNAAVVMKSSFDQQERALAERLVKATRRENKFLRNLAVAVISKPKLRSSPGPNGTTSKRWTGGGQTGLLRLERQGEALALTGVVGQLKPGRHELFIERLVGTLAKKSFSSSFTLRQRDESKSTDGIQLKLTPESSVDVERIGTAVADNSGWISTRLSLPGKSIEDLLGRAVFVRGVGEEAVPTEQDPSKSVVAWGFVTKPVGGLSMTDDTLWKRVFPDVRAFDLPRNADPLLAELKRMGSPSPDKGIPGRLANSRTTNGAIELDGRRSFLSTAIRHDGKQPITLEAWVTPSDLSGDRELIGNPQDGGLELGFYDGVCKFLVHDGSRYRVIAAQSPTQPKTKVHVAGVFDGNKSVLFVDGRKQGMAHLAGPGKPSPLPVFIGANPKPDNPTKRFSGQIDELRISRTARYTAEFVPKRSLSADAITIAAYSFSEGSGGFARDSSGNGLDAKLSSTKWVGNQPTRQDVVVLPKVGKEQWDTPARFSMFIADKMVDAGVRAQEFVRLAAEFDAAGASEQASAAVSKATEALSQIEDASSKCTTTVLVARALVKADKTESALALLRQSVVHAQQIEDADDRTLALRSISRGFDEAGDTQRAIEVMGQAVETAQTIASPDRRVNSLMQESFLSDPSSNKEVSMILLEAAFNAARQIEDPQRGKVAMWRIVAAVANADDLTRAIALGRETASSNTKPSAPPPTSRRGFPDPFSAGLGEIQSHRQTALLSIASAAARAGDLERARATIGQATDAAKKIMADNPRSTALSRVDSTKAEVARSLAERKEFDQAIDLAESIDGLLTKSFALVDLAEGLNKAGETDQALEILKRTVEAGKEIQPDRLQADLLLKVASAMATAGDEQLALDIRVKAVEKAERSLQSIQEIASPTSRQRYLSLIAQTLVRAGEEEQALAALKGAADASIAASATPMDTARAVARSPLTPLSLVRSLASTAETISECGDRDLATKTLQAAFEVAQKIERAASYSSDDPRAEAMMSLTRSLRRESSESPGPVQTVRVAARRLRGAAPNYRLKPRFTPLELDLAEKLAQDCLRSERIASARDQLRTAGALPSAVARLADDTDPEIAWLAATADLRKRSISLYRADRVTVERLIEDLKTLLADRDYDSEANFVADSLLRSVSRTEHQDLLASIYQFVGEKMSESNNAGLRSRSSSMLGTARRLTLIGKDMDLSGTTVDDKDLDWDAYRGKVVLVEFWASWCTPCRKEHRNIKRTLEAFGEKGFAVLGVNIDRDLNARQRYIETQGLVWPMLASSDPRKLATNHPVAARYAVTEVPTCILVDKEGKVVSLEARDKELERLVRDLLGERPKVTPWKEMKTDSENRPNRFAKLQASTTQVGDIYLRQGEIDQAIEQYRNALKFGPDYAPAQRGLGNAMIKQGKLKEGLVELRTAISLDPNSANTHNSLAWAIVTHPAGDGSYRDVSDAVASGKKACELDLDNYAYLNTLGVALYRNGDWKEALVALEDSVKLGAEIPHNWLFLAMAKWQLGEKQQASELFTKSLAWRQKRPKDDELEMFFTEASMLLGLDMEVEPNLATDRQAPMRSEDKGPAARASIHLNRASDHLRRKNWSGARREYRSALALQPVTPEIWLKLLDVAWWEDSSNGRSLDDAIAICAEARQAIGEDHPELSLEVGHAWWCLRTDQQEEYEKICQLVLDRHSRSENPRTQFQVARILALGERSIVPPDQIVKFAKKAIAADPTQGYFRTALAHSLIRAGQYEEALASSEGNAALTAMSHACMGSDHEARKWLQMARNEVTGNPLGPGSTWYPTRRMMWELYLRETERILAKQ